MDELPPYALEVSPESTLELILNRSPTEGHRSPSATDGNTRCVMKIHHPGKTNQHLAFKVKTTQPRRYLVRPNQGIVAPGATENITILLVDKDKQVLLQSFDRLGQSALDHSKDKFLVQSCALPDDISARFSGQQVTDESLETSKLGKDLSEALTAMWNASGSDSSMPTYSKKLQVKLIVDATTTGNSNPSSAPNPIPTLSDKTKVETMSPEQMFAEITSLRRKYDELVSFSVNLTAERDILNNSLEQTKRDLNREIATRSALESGYSGRQFNRGKKDGTKSGISIKMVLLVSILSYVFGIRAANLRSFPILYSIPIIKSFLGVRSVKDIPITPCPVHQIADEKSEL